MVVNKFKLRNDIRSINLAGMGCSASVIAIDIAKDMLAVRAVYQCLLSWIYNVCSVSRSFFGILNSPHPSLVFCVDRLLSLFGIVPSRAFMFHCFPFSYMDPTPVLYYGYNDSTQYAFQGTNLGFLDQITI